MYLPHAIQGTHMLLAASLGGGGHGTRLLVTSDLKERRGCGLFGSGRHLQFIEIGSPWTSQIICIGSFLFSVPFSAFEDNVF